MKRRDLGSLAAAAGLGLALCAGSGAGAAAPHDPPTLVVVTGLGGEPRFDRRFHAWAATLMDAAEAGGLTAANIVYLAGDPGQVLPEGGQRDNSRARAASTRDNVLATLAELAAAASSRPLFLVIIGHGSYRDGVSKVNLPGPDMTAADLAAALAAFGDRPIVVANLTSASGGFIAELSRPGRVVITATRSGTERNAAVFAGFFAAAFVGDAADADHDDRLSVLEAFDYAREEVERAYERERKLLTEHALLDDNGDGEGTAEPSIDAEDGRLAASLTLIGPRGAVGAAAGDPELERLYREKTGLEGRVAELRRRKAEMSRQDYEDRLEELLVELALANRAIRQLARPASAAGEG